MPQSVCIEQIEGYIRNRGKEDSFSIEDDGTAIEIRVPATRMVTKEGSNVIPIRITVSEAPCGIILTMPDVHHPIAYVAVHAFPKKIGQRSSGLRPSPYTMMAAYASENRQLNLKMVVPAVGPSVTGSEFYEAVVAFVQIADRWAARNQRPPAQQREDQADGSAGPIDGPSGFGPENE